MRLILPFIFILLFYNSYAQVPMGIFNEKEKEYFQTLGALSNYLRKEKTPKISFHETEFYSTEEAFYDTVINIFFEKDKMLKSFEKDTSVFAVKGKFDMLRHVLNGCDKYLDTFPRDSILIEPQGHSSNVLLQKNNNDPVLDTFLLKDNKKIHMLTWLFDEKTNKIAGLAIVDAVVPTERNK